MPIILNRERAFVDLQNVVHSSVPDTCRVDVHIERNAARGICGDHGRVVPQRQGLCPHCAGYLHDAAQVRVMREMAGRLRAA